MRIRTNSRATMALAAAMFCSSQAGAQHIERGNPFEAPPAWSEEEKLLEERIRVIFRQMEPGMRNDVLKQVREADAALELKLRRRIDLLAQEAATAARSGAPEGGGAKANNEGEAGSAQAVAVPEGATFVACVNKGAIYRDSKNILVKVPETDPQSIALCAR